MNENQNILELYKHNFLEYASYVIKDRALPELLDGLKPVQRRILHSLYEIDDGRFHKVANVIGNTMKYHPHGDASIGDALVVLSNKGYFIDQQGNFGNILTGDSASAARYIECRLSSLAKEVMFDKEITQYVDSYDGRNKEPVIFPCKIPYILLHGTEGIAVGMSTKILPHNFNEVLKAQISYLNGEPFKLYPDFFQGGIIDVSEYSDGNGNVKVRAKIDIKNPKTLLIKQIPYSVTSERIIASIEDAIRRNKIKVSTITDYTTENIEIELATQRGISADEVLDRLYAYTECEIKLHSNINLIMDGFPRTLTVTEIVHKITDNLIEILKAELKIKIEKLSDKLHTRSLEQIFIENKIYKNIESAETIESALEIMRKSLKPYTKDWDRPVTDEDLNNLLEIPIKKITKFDINKSNEEIEELRKKIKIEKNHLAAIKKYTISFLESLLKKYGPMYPRKTQIKSFEVVNAKDLNDTDTKIFYDRSSGYIGTKVKGEAKIECSSFDKILLISQKGTLKVVPVPEKLFCEKLLYFNVIDKEQIFNTLSRDKKSGNVYVKRFKVDKFIQNKDYEFIDPGHRLEAFTARNQMEFIVEYERNLKDKETQEKYDFETFPIRGPQNRGNKVSTRKISKTQITSKNLEKSSST
ncbi:MAG: hypothetical protein ACD_79C00133G0003 [uncultured bacterium]|nr:MAG: hypothetical protein ACD_79C00133G0003 [uncultured bacterium]